MRTIFLIISLLIICNPIIAEDGTSEWDLVFYSGQEETLYWVTKDGITDSLPLIPNSQYPDDYPDYAISSDKRYFAYATYDISLGDDGWFDYSSTVYLVDLDEHSCCEVINVENPYPDAQTVYSVQAFNPDGTQLALRYSTMSDENVETEYPTGKHGFMIIDLASGKITDPQIPSLLNYDIFEWTEDGLLFKEICDGRNCGGGDNPPKYFIWYGADTREDYIPPRFPIQSLSTGETLQLHSLTTSNRDECCRYAVMYSNGDEQYPIYVDEEKYDVAFSVYWVADGQFAFLVPNSFNSIDPRFDWQGLLIGRDGTTTLIPLEQQKQWIASTPDGWLMQEKNIVYHYQWQGGNNFHKEAMDIPSNLTLIYRLIRVPELGTNLNDIEPFPHAGE